MDDFTKAMQFKVLVSIRSNWKSLDAFLRDWNYQASHSDREANRIFSRISKSLHLDRQALSNIAGRAEDGKRQVGAFLKSLGKTNPRLVHVGKKTATYKSGKSFNAPSWFYIPFAELERLWRLQGTSQDPFSIRRSSSFYTDGQKRLISAYILGYRERRTYTKGEKFAEYQKSRRKKTVRDSADDEILLTKDEIDEILDGLY